jgi:hypothetical protein
VEAADAKCQRLATTRPDLPPLPGTYLAWLSTEGAGGVSPATRFRHSAQPYILVNGTPIASNWATLTDGSIDAPLNVTETGNVLGDTQNAWTNTQPNGTPGGLFPGGHCQNWTSASGKLITGNLGVSDTTTVAWTAGSSSACSTDQFGTTGLRLYCFQQD